MAKKKGGKKKAVAQFSDSQLEAVVENLNGDLGWNESDHVAVDELENLEASDFEEDEIEDMKMVTLAYLDANCDGFADSFEYELKPLDVEEEEEEDEEPAPKKKGGKKKGGKKKAPAKEEEPDEEEEEDEEPAPKKKGGKKKADKPAPKKKGGKKKAEEVEDEEVEDEDVEDDSDADAEEEAPTKKGGKKKAPAKKETGKKKAPAKKKKGAESIVKGSKTKKHWDSRFGILPVIEAADEGLTFDEICEAVQEYCADEFSIEHSVESIEASVMFVLPMFVVNELVEEDISGDEATYSIAE